MSFLQAYNAWCNCVLFKPLQQSLKAKGSQFQLYSWKQASAFDRAEGRDARALGSVRSEIGNEVRG